MKEAIILAGGLGTRLRSVVSDRPKSIAEVAGRPFIYYLINQLIDQGVQKIILALGFESQQIIQWIEDEDFPVEIHFSIESEPLGTGGALRQAMKLCDTNEVLAMNGDSYTSFDLDNFLAFHSEKKSDTSLILFPMQDFERYGVVEIDPETDRILKFNEKQKTKQGDINTGVYIIDKSIFLSSTPEGKFSLEKDFLEKYVSSLEFYGMETEGIFIDIGVPEDYERAQSVFKDF